MGTKKWWHICRNHLPKYQWTFCEGRTRFRFLAYSRELTLTNGLAFEILVMLWLRKFGIQETVHWQTDWGEEFGGSNPHKLRELQERFYGPFNAVLNRIPKGKKEYNGRVERSHQTDDYEFYIPFILRIQNESELLKKAQAWQYIYNVKRAHFGKKMDKKTPLQKLQELGYNLNEEFAMFPVLILDDIAPDILTHVPGNELLAQDRKVKEWLKEHELITLVFLPTNASWLNHIEPYFKDVKRFVINGSNYVSKKEMKKALRGYIKWTNKMIKIKQKVKGNYLKQ
ncbi:MAG: hypothetical protein ACE5J3_13520 [Methanosarcinales archaeon]